MDAVWIGFLGVIVGGVITTVWSWLAVVRQELSDAVVAARLVDENLAAIGEAASTSPGRAEAHINVDIWEHNRAALARALGRWEWADVSVIYRPRDGQLPDDLLGAQVAKARSALQQPVAGKLSIVGQRWRNMFGRRTSRWSSPT
jgi:hypothetical protein